MIDEVRAVLEGAVPKNWFVGPLGIELDDEEILCVGPLSPEKSVESFREETRAARMEIAAKVESRFGRKVAWGVDRDGATTIFTSLNSPVMTRLRLKERAVLDTLVDAGVARSRSDALAWCVKLVGRHQEQWLAELREALVGVENVRSEGPTLI
jgi:hypothetical protein